MALRAAQPAEVLRAWQKDDLYKSKLADSLAQLLGATRAHTAPSMAAALYSVFTTLQDLQTLGEEYSGIVQVDYSYSKLPSVTTRVVSIILSIFGESFAKNLFRRWEKKIENDNRLRTEAKNFFIVSLQAMAKMLPQIERIYRATCYIYGGPIQIGKMLSGIDYVQAKPAAAAYYTHLRLLGFITLAHAILSCGQSIHKVRKDLSDVSQYCNEPEMSNACVACLENLGRPCTLPCGHIFCMQCCYGSLQSCALCRTGFSRNYVVPLQNYSPCL